MPKTGMDENGNGAEFVAHEEETNARRQMLKQIGLTTGALVVAALGSSGASARDREAPADQSSDVEDRIIERALKDKEYRRRLVADPRTVIGEEIGSALPPHMQIKVVQDTPDLFYVVLPYVPAIRGDRVSNRELQDGADGMAIASSRRCCRCSSLSVCK